MNNDPIIIERKFTSPVDQVWRAITNKDVMKQWYFDLPEFKPEFGTEFQFYGGTEDHQYLHLCKIVEVIIEKKISYSWRYDGYTGSSLVIFELFEEENQTRLNLTHEGLETFPADNPDFAKENFIAGWTSIIGKSLKEFLESGKV